MKLIILRAVTIILADETADDDRQLVVPYSDVLPGSLKVESNYKQVLEFSIRGAPDASFNIKFNSKEEAINCMRKKVTRHSVLEALIQN